MKKREAVSRDGHSLSSSRMGRERLCQFQPDCCWRNGLLFLQQPDFFTHEDVFPTAVLVGGCGEVEAGLLLEDEDED